MLVLTASIANTSAVSLGMRLLNCVFELSDTFANFVFTGAFFVSDAWLIAELGPLLSLVVGVVSFFNLAGTGGTFCGTGALSIALRIVVLAFVQLWCVLASLQEPILPG